LSSELVEVCHHLHDVPVVPRSWGRWKAQGLFGGIAGILCLYANWGHTIYLTHQHNALRLNG